MCEKPEYFWRTNIALLINFHLSLLNLGLIFMFDRTINQDMFRPIYRVDPIERKYHQTNKDQSN